MILFCADGNRYRRLTRFGPPLTRFGPPIISSISQLFLGVERYVAFWYINFQLTAENSHYLAWLKTLCSWAKARQSWAKRRPTTVCFLLPRTKGITSLLYFRGIQEANSRQFSLEVLKI